MQDQKLCMYCKFFDEKFFSVPGRGVCRFSKFKNQIVHTHERCDQWQEREGEGLDVSKDK